MKSIILLSGGLDSALNLALALEKRSDCIALSFDYGQKHRVELNAARRLAEYYQIPHRVIKIDTSAFGSCSLINGTVVKDREMSDLAKDKISPNYVPARNTLFLSYALAIAEVENASEIYFGGNAADHAFPDCSPAYIQAMQNTISHAVPHRKITVVAPLLHLTKKDIVKEAKRLQLPIEMTHSCYDPIGDNICERCDACLVRSTALKDSA